MPNQANLHGSFLLPSLVDSSWWQSQAGAMERHTVVAVFQVFKIRCCSVLCCCIAHHKIGKSKFYISTPALQASHWMTQELSGVLKQFEKRLRAVEKAQMADDTESFLLSVTESIKLHTAVASLCEETAGMQAPYLPKLLREHANGVIARATMQQVHMIPLDVIFCRCSSRSAMLLIRAVIPSTQSSNYQNFYCTKYVYLILLRSSSLSTQLSPITWFIKRALIGVISMMANTGT